MNEMIYLGEDLGMGANKLFGEKGGLMLLSQVASNGTSHLTEVLGLKARKRPMAIQSTGGSFYVGEGAHDYGRPVENLDFDRLTGAPEMRALVYGTLTQYQQEHGNFEAPLSLMVGLPLQMLTGEAAKGYQDAVKKWLKGRHSWTADGSAYEVEIQEVRLTPQPVGALFDYVMDDGGQLIADRRGILRAEVGILSVGFNTLELLVVREQSAVERFTAGNTVGVRRLLELLNRDGMYSLGELDLLVRNNKVDLSQALPIWAREVNGEIEKRWGQSFRRFAKVLVVGGGALLLRDHLTAQFKGKALVPDNPVMAISRGLWKLSLRRR